jgi:hypothetical protein
VNNWNGWRARTRRQWMVGAGLAMALIGVLASTAVVFAQEVPVETYPAPGKPESRSAPRRVPTMPTHPPRTGTYHRDVGVGYEPAFIEPLAGKYTKAGGGRFGLSGWTAPNVPVGGAQSGAPDVDGWASLGFTFTWGEPH